MPAGPKPRTKAAKAAKVEKVMHEFKGGELHSGSKTGPEVTNPKQAVAIALSESGQSKSPKKGYDRSSHHPGNPGSPSSTKAGESPAVGTYADDAPRSAGHAAPALGARTHGYGHAIGQRRGTLRCSGHPGAHQLGRR